MFIRDHHILQTYFPLQIGNKGKFEVQVQGLDTLKTGLQKQTVYQMNPLDKRDCMQQVTDVYLLK